jgi:hypothetical protein
VQCVLRGAPCVPKNVDDIAIWTQAIAFDLFIRAPGMTAPIPLVGVLTRRLEDAELVRGAARYVADLQIPGMLYVAFVRCPLGHARVRTLSLDRARRMPASSRHSAHVIWRPWRSRCSP